MDGLLIKDWLDILPKWLGFALRFPVNPADALGPYAASGIVSKDLTWLAVAGLGVSYVLIASVPPPLSAEERSSPLIGFLQRIDLKVLPTLMILLLVAFSVGLHLLVKLYLALLPIANWGTIEDTVNATLGFSSVYIPFYTLTFVMAVRLGPLSERGERKGPMVLALLIISVSTLVLFVYLPLSLAVVHRINFWSTLIAFFVALSIAYGIYSLIKKWVKNA